MSKNARLKREAKRYSDCEHVPDNVLQYQARKKPLEPITENQRQYLSSLFHDTIVIGAGVAGTGKTYLSSRVAAKLLTESKIYKQIIMTRPNVEVGRSLGFLKGDLEEKYAPYMEPFEAGISDELGGARLQSGLGKTFKPQPLGYMRGKTFDNSIMLLDEAQNTTIEEMKMFITRIGQNTRMFITGDDSDGQNDLRVPENGLQWLIRQFRTQQMPYDIVTFRDDDCVRSEECKSMLKMISRAT